MLKNLYIKAGSRIIANTVLMPDIGELVTVPNVPMVSTGIDYPTANGLITLTEKDLIDLVASQDDPAIHPPRTKVGHSDPRFNSTVQADGTVLDGEPSLGSWINLRLGDNGQTVYGDVAGVPKWFASILSTAYPSRSIEGNWDVETVTGHTWRLAVDAVAMLGVVGPGITTLADLPMYFSEQGPDNVQVIEAKEGEEMSVVRAARASIPPPVTASVNLEDVRRSFYDQASPEQFWWWIRAIYIDPNELIVDDDEGGLFRIPFSTGDGDNAEVTFQEAQPVQIQYVDKPKAAASARLRAALAKALGQNRVVATYAVRAESKPPGGSMTPEQIALLRQRMNLTPEQLADDADDATILRVLSEAQAPTEPAPTPTPEAPPATTATAEPAVTETVTPPPAIPAGMVLVDETTFNEVREQAQQGAAVASRLNEESRDSFIDNAITAGKFPPSRREHYLTAWRADPEGTRGLIDTLSPGLVPMQARGTSGSAEQAGADPYPTDWLSPGERNRIAAAKQPAAAVTPAIVEGGD